MLKMVSQFILLSFITGFLGAAATGTYSLLVSQVTTDLAAGQQEKMILILQEISGKLSKTVSRSADIDFQRSNTIDPTKLFIAYQTPEYQGRVFGIGAKRYRSSFSIMGLGKANILNEDIVKIEWDYSGKRATTFKQYPLFLTNMNMDFELTARIWLGEELVKKMGLTNPLLLTIQVEL